MQRTSFVSAMLFVIVAISCKTVSRFPIDDPQSGITTRYLIGKWRCDEDTDKNNFFEVTRSLSGSGYRIKYWNKEGTNPAYESNAFLSRINDVTFVNVPYWPQEHDDYYRQSPGYVFFRILNVSPDSNRLMTATISDTALHGLSNSLDVYNKVAKNLNNKKYYSDTVHFQRWNN